MVPLSELFNQNEIVLQFLQWEIENVRENLHSSIYNLWKKSNNLFHEFDCPGYSKHDLAGLHWCKRVYNFIKLDRLCGLPLNA